MTLSGSLPLSQLSTQDLHSLNLQNQERISAEVLQVAGDRVYLAVNGVRVVARLTSADQAARLMEQRQANFIVKDFSESEILLQLIPGDGSSADPTTGPVSLIPELLARAGLEENRLNSRLVQHLLQEGLPVHKDLVVSLGSFLEANQLTDSRSLAAAAFLLARGLAISPGILALVTADLPPLGEILKKWASARVSTLPEKKLSRKPGSGPLPGEAKSLLITADSQYEQVLLELKRALPLLGDSLESQLGKLLQRREKGPEDLSRGNYPEIFDLPDRGGSRDSSDTHQLLDRLRLSQYANSRSEKPSSQPRWLHFELPIVFPEVNGTDELRTAYLKVHAPGDDSVEELQERPLSFILQLGSDNQDLVRVDLHLYQGKLRAAVQASSSHLLEAAERELPALKGSLASQGYLIEHLGCRLNKSLSLPESSLEIELDGSAASSIRADYAKINIEI